MEPGICRDREQSGACQGPGLRALGSGAALADGKLVSWTGGGFKGEPTNRKRGRNWMSNQLGEPVYKRHVEAEVEPVKKLEPWNKL